MPLQLIKRENDCWHHCRNTEDRRSSTTLERAVLVIYNGPVLKKYIFLIIKTREGKEIDDV
jgi:hypothetical protein